jgi:hypothetical protein
MRRRKESREEAVERADRAERALFAHSMALRAAMTEDLPMIAQASADGWHYRLYATGLARCDGGHVVVRADCKGQVPNVVAYNALDYIAERQRVQRTFTRLDDEAACNARLLEAIQLASTRANTTTMHDGTEEEG